MSADDEAPRPEDAYEVGYKKPPKETRFKKGRSGNPKGRRKGARNFKTDLLRTLKAPVAIIEDGKKRTVSTQEAMLMRFREKALKGDARAIDRLVALAQVHNIEDEKQGAKAPPSESDRAIIERALARRMALDDAPKAAPQGEQGGDAPPTEGEGSGPADAGPDERAGGDA